MKKLIIFIACFWAITLQAQTVKVAAAANLRFVMEEIKAKYEQENPNVKIEITLGSSGALTQQIINGAPFDFFMAADVKFPTKVKEQGCASGDVKTYAFGKLALWSNTLDVTKGIDVIKENSVNKIAIAKPELAPYGAKAIECLKFYNLYDAAKGKLVYADNIAQTVQFAESGNAEVAFIAYSLIFGPEMKGKGSAYVLDTKSYKPVEQACVLLKSWNRNPEAAKFMDFILSSGCKPIFENYGYLVP
jgi:molybdate transport system substrate-binding protein